MERERDALVEKIKMLENTLSLSENERQGLGDKIRELQELETRQRNESRDLRSQLEATSGHRSKDELKMKAFEGELNRLEADSSR